MSKEFSNSFITIKVFTENIFPDLSTWGIYAKSAAAKALQLLMFLQKFYYKKWAEWYLYKQTPLTEVIITQALTLVQKVGKKSSIKF